MLCSIVYKPTVTKSIEYCDSSGHVAIPGFTWWVRFHQTQRHA